MSLQLYYKGTPTQVFSCGYCKNFQNSFFLQNISSSCFFIVKYNQAKGHCVKSVRIRSFSGPYFPAFGLSTGLNTERVSLRTQSECRKLRTRKTLNAETFQAVNLSQNNYNNAKIESSNTNDSFQLIITNQIHQILIKVLFGCLKINATKFWNIIAVNL